MNKADRLYKLQNGTETAVWAHDEIVKQDKRIAELDKRFASVAPVVAFLARENVIETERGLKIEFDEWITRRYLEQQAKALEDAHKYIVKEEMFRCARDYIKQKAIELRKQAKGGAN